MLAMITAISIASVILPKYANFFLNSSLAQSEVKEFVSALVRQVDHPLAIHDLIDQVSSAKPWALVYVVTGIALFLYLALRPFAAAYRLKRMIFNLYPDTGKLSAVPIGLSASRSMGIYDLEDRLFRHLGARRPAERAYDLFVAALPLPFVVGLGFHNPVAGTLLTAIAMTRLGWLLRTWRSRLSARSGTISNVVVNSTSPRWVPRSALVLGVVSVLTVGFGVIPAAVTIFLATWSDATSTYAAGRYRNRAVTLAAKILAWVAIVFAGLLVL